MEDALDSYEEALVVFRDTGDRQGTGMALLNVGLVAGEQGRFDRARESLDEALSLRREIGERPGIGETLTELGALALARGAFDEADGWYEQAAVVHLDTGRPQSLVEDHIGHAHAAFARGDRVAAAAWLAKVVPYLDEQPELAVSPYPMRDFALLLPVLAALDHPRCAGVLEIAAATIQRFLEEADEESAGISLRQPHHAVVWTMWKERTAG